MINNLTKKLSATLLVGLIGLGTVTSQNMAELLGHPKESKLLIMHADDLGVSHSVNQASIEAFEKGGISSSSIMVPCPWFGEIAEYARDNPQFCWGLHLTLTSEWKYYKWDGCASSDRITSLLNEDNVFYDKVIDVVSNAKLDEVEVELRAQIEKAIKAGINVSHLDSHMGTLFATPELFKLYVTLGNEYELPVMIPGARVPPSWDIDSFLGEIQYPLDQLVMLNEMSDDWTAMYDSMVDKVGPGLNEIIVHLGYDDAELQAVMIDHPAFGANWRQKDLDYVLSDHYKKKLAEHDIILISWNEVRRALFLKHNKQSK